MAQSYEVRGDYPSSMVAPQGNAAGGSPTSNMTTYAYNALGSLLTLADPLGHVTSYQYDADQNLTKNTDANGHSTTYTYDARGNRVGIAPAGVPPTNLTYDQANRLTAYGTGVTYTYDGDGLRMSKAVTGAITGFTWNETGQIPLLLQAGGMSYIYGPGGQPIEQVSGTTVTYLQQDQQGSTRLLTDSTGAVWESTTTRLMEI